MWRDLRAAHDKNQQEWHLRAIKADHVLFTVENYFGPRYSRGLDSQIEVAKENLRLLEERRQVDQAQAAVDKIRQGPKDWQARIDHQDEKIKGAKMKCSR
jgi:hypothetical protein